MALASSFVSAWYTDISSRRNASERAGCPAGAACAAGAGNLEACAERDRRPSCARTRPVRKRDAVPSDVDTTRSSLEDGPACRRPRPPRDEDLVFEVGDCPAERRQEVCSDADRVLGGRGSSREAWRCPTGCPTRASSRSESALSGTDSTPRTNTGRAKRFFTASRNAFSSANLRFVPVLPAERLAGQDRKVLALVAHASDVGTERLEERRRCGAVRLMRANARGHDPQDGGQRSTLPEMELRLQDVGDRVQLGGSGFAFSSASSN